MGLSSLHLDAFFAAAKSLNFSQAAKELHITQSALSQRIKALEEDLGLTLFVRMPRGVKLTDSGERLLRYCQARHSLEREVLDELTGADHTALGGALRIGGFSSLMRSILIPALTPLLRANPKVQPQFQQAEMRELPDLLFTGQVDFIVTDSDISRADVETIELGTEAHVLCESREFGATENVYIDHDPFDPTTVEYLRAHLGKAPTMRRAFMSEIYALIDGVAAGLGRAVVSVHLARGDDRLAAVEGYPVTETAVKLHYYRQPFYTELHKAVLAELTAEIPRRLADSR